MERKEHLTMPVIVNLNGVDLYYESEGEGPPLVLVHGDWSDHTSWQLVAPALAESFRVVRYDRRGFSRSSRPAELGPREHQEDDLAALIEALGLAPAHVVATSFGAAIALGLATRRPELMRSLVIHEPPLMGLVADDPEVQPLTAPVLVSFGAVLERIARGDLEGATRQFVEEIALGPGGWELLPEANREIAVRNALPFLDQHSDPGATAIDRAALAGLAVPTLVTEGAESPRWFHAIVAELADGAACAEAASFPGAGHAPHLTHPGDYASVVSAFLGSPERTSAAV
jgi:pimeloyl-ACP methyl ester carboxylesterase